MGDSLNITPYMEMFVSDAHLPNDNPDLHLISFMGYGSAYITSSLFRYKVDWDKVSIFMGQGKFPGSYIKYKATDTLMQKSRDGSL